MNDPLAFLPSLALLVQIVAGRVFEKLVVDVLFFFGDFGLDALGLFIGWRRARLVRVGRQHDRPRGNDRATYRQSSNVRNASLHGSF